MISDDITSCAAALGSLAGHVDEEHWALLRVVRQNLQAHAEQVKNIEDSMRILPGGDIGLKNSGRSPQLHVVRGAE